MGGERQHGIVEGLTLFGCHSSASLLIQENADPDVRGDLNHFARLVPDGDPLFRHRDDGVDDMPSHVRSALTENHLRFLCGAVDHCWEPSMAPTCGSTG